MKSLETLRECLTELNTTNSMLEKKKILARYPGTKQYFVYAYDPDITFGVTSKSLIKKSIEGLPKRVYLQLPALLDALAARELTGHEAHKSINLFTSTYPEYRNIVHMMLDKNLKVRMGVTQINEVWPDLIDDFKVALAKEHEKHKSKVDFKKQDWYVSRKLDGLRCVTVIDSEGEAICYTRTGKMFITFGVVIAEIKRLGLKNMVLDGEMCIVDEKGNEDFSAIHKLWDRKNFTIPNPKYLVFDQLTLEEFDNAKGTRPLSFRTLLLAHTLEGESTKIIQRVPQIKVASKQHFAQLREEARKNKWEGLILRKNMEYKGKRTDELLKVKSFIDAEFEVFEIESKVIRVIDKKSDGGTGLEIEILCMSKAIIHYKGNNVGVGSGWTLQERKDYHARPADLVGRMITVQYFEESVDKKTGKPSLRFPTVKCVHKKGKRIV
jgi:DNA ligase 1